MFVPDVVVCCESVDVAASDKGLVEVQAELPLVSAVAGAGAHSDSVPDVRKERKKEREIESEYVCVE